MAKYTYLESPQGAVFGTTHPEYHTDCTKSSKAAYVAYIKQDLRKIIKPGDRIYTMVRSVAASGMSRRISCYVVQKGRIRDISSMVATVTGSTESRNGGVQVSGCGMDMPWHLVYSLGRALFPDGFLTSTEATHNVNGGKLYAEPHATKAEIENMHARGWQFKAGRNGDKSGWDNDGGYALKKESM